MNQNNYGPKNISINDIFLNVAGIIMSGIIGSVIIIIFVFVLSNIMEIPTNIFNKTSLSGQNNIFLPFILSLVTFLVTLFTSNINYIFLKTIDSNNYKTNSIIFFNINLFSIIFYIFFIPIYIFLGMKNYENIVYVFISNVLIINFGQLLLLELLNNFRYILLGFYGSFIGMFLSSSIIYIFFNFFSSGYAKLISLLIILPLSGSLMILFKGLFDIIYYKYFLLTGNDNLSDIFSQIESEERDILKKNIIEKQNLNSN
ncbi:MAG: hypothetical protein NWP80_02180 [Candidatus Gracilibacteria bacterium]|nr:hypothetical protein [Candidatus Gracilibacteria bacterium]